MPIKEAVLVAFITAITIGYGRYKRDKDILKVFSHLITVESLTAMAIIETAYFVLKFIFGIFS